MQRIFRTNPLQETAQLYSNIMELVQPLQAEECPSSVRASALCVHGLASLQLALPSPEANPPAPSTPPSAAAAGTDDSADTAMSVHVVADTRAEGVSLLQQCVKLQPAAVGAWDALGQALYGAGDLLGAKAAFEGAIMGGGGAIHLAHLSMTLRGLARHVPGAAARGALVEASLQRAKEAVACDPKCVTALQALGNGCMTMYTSVRSFEHAAQALRAYKTAIDTLQGGEGGAAVTGTQDDVPLDEQVGLFVNAGQMLRITGERLRAAGMFIHAAAMATRGGDGAGKQAAMGAWGELVLWSEGVNKAVGGVRLRKGGALSPTLPGWYREPLEGGVSVAHVMGSGRGRSASNGSADSKAHVVHLGGLVDGVAAGSVTCGHPAGTVAQSGDEQDPCAVLLTDGAATVAVALHHVLRTASLPALGPSDVLAVVNPRVTRCSVDALRTAGRAGGAAGVATNDAFTLLTVFSAHEVLLNGRPLLPGVTAE